MKNQAKSLGFVTTPGLASPGMPPALPPSLGIAGRAQGDIQCQGPNPVLLHTKSTLSLQFFGPAHFLFPLLGVTPDDKRLVPVGLWEPHGMPRIKCSDSCMQDQPPNVLSTSHTNILKSLTINFGNARGRTQGRIHPRLVLMSG